MSVVESITVCVDGQAHSVPCGTHLAELLARLGHAPDSIAVAVNGDFVPRSERPRCVLSEADHIASFKPIVGG